MNDHFDLTSASSRINYLIGRLNASRYLEIGVLNGGTFSRVNCNHKVAVDPNFRFDYKERESDNEKYHQTTSDNYFSMLDKNETFDVIFLDGLHTFEQTYRDLCNSLAHSHTRTIILMDDTFPNDPYSALNNQTKCNKMRKHDRNPNLTWHGDVYKCIFAIRSFHPYLNYRTISGPGNPQTVIWKRGEAIEAGTYSVNFEYISRLSYFDLIENSDVMNFAEAEDALLECLSGLRF